MAGVEARAVAAADERKAEDGKRSARRLALGTLHSVIGHALMVRDAMGVTDLRAQGVELRLPLCGTAGHSRGEAV